MEGFLKDNVLILQYTVNRIKIEKKRGNIVKAPLQKICRIGKKRKSPRFISVLKAFFYILARFGIT